MPNALRTKQIWIEKRGCIVINYKHSLLPVYLAINNPRWETFQFGIYACLDHFSSSPKSVGKAFHIVQLLGCLAPKHLYQQVQVNNYLEDMLDNKLQQARLVNCSFWTLSSIEKQVEKLKFSMLECSNRSKAEESHDTRKNGESFHEEINHDIYESIDNYS